MTKLYAVQTISEGRRTLHPDDDGARRTCFRSDVRLGHDRACALRVGPSLGYLRHLAGRDECRSSAATIGGVPHFRLAGGKGLRWNLSTNARASRTLKSLAYDLVAGRNRSRRPARSGSWTPFESAGPFEVSIARPLFGRRLEGLRRSRASGSRRAAKLENYIEVICRLYRKDAAIQGATGLVHAVAETEKARRSRSPSGRSRAA